MTIEIRPAADDLEHRAAYKLRARVFGGEGILRRNAAELFDVFDALPSSSTIVAVDHGEVIGSVRMTWHGNNETPCDEYFDGAAALPSDAVIGSGSLLCVDPARRTGTLGLRMVDWVMRRHYEVGASHGLAPVRPQAEPIFTRLGWFRVAHIFEHPIECVPVVPMAVELAAVFGRSTRAQISRAASAPSAMAECA